MLPLASWDIKRVPMKLNLNQINL